MGWIYVSQLHLDFMQKKNFDEITIENLSKTGFGS